MRAYQFITEAPIADFAILGDPNSLDDTRGSWHPSDTKLLQSEKGIKKIYDIFSKTPYNFNLYVIAENVVTNLGMSKEEFEEKFSKKIQTERNITVIYTNNVQSKNGTPLTGWAMAHRIGHALQIANINGKRTTLSSIADEYEVKIMQAYIDAVAIYSGEPSLKVKPDYFGVEMSSNTLANKKIKIAASKLLTTRAGRMNLLNNIETELYCELIAQYLVTGRVKLNSDNPEVLKQQDTINQLMKQLFDRLVGEVIAF